ncbi:MAG: translation initiation factor IF-2, partial [Lachnospiraceae bacterium]|nr:translation initiation factor IF-2 [Lachnospiraceae bacterium]
GSVEAVEESLEKLSNDEVVVKVIHAGVGNVNESDAILASASNAIIIAFNVQADAVARDTIEHEKVDMRKYSVIYNAIDDVEAAMNGMLEPVYEEVIIGHVEVRQTFKASGIGIIAGSYIIDGNVTRDAKVRLTRDDELLFDGPIASLKRFQDDVKEVKAGYECGIVLNGFSDIREGDHMEAYIMKEVPRK